MEKEIPQPTNIFFETKGVPTVYANQASVSVNYYEIRIYFSELLPKTMSGSIGSPKRAEATIDPKVSLVCAPEFAKSLAKSILNSVEQYEQAFGTLRSEPTAESVEIMMAKLGITVSPDKAK